MTRRNPAVFGLAAVAAIGLWPMAPVSATEHGDGGAKTDGVAAGCFWNGPTGRLDVPDDNYAFPDSGARYFFSTFTMPPGARVVLDGKYAHARYQSLNSYDGAIPTDALNDVATKPDAGSRNPFLPGANRGRNAHRDYTAYVVNETPPTSAQTRAENTLYAGVPGQKEITLVYRLYVPDKNRDDTGGVGLPEPVVELADGSTVSGSAVCDTLAAKKLDRLPITSLPAATYDFLRNPAKNSLAQRAGFPAFAAPVWRAYYNSSFNIFCDYKELCGGTPTRTGGQYSNIDNNYVSTFANPHFGKVLVLRGKLPVTPKTYQRRPFMDRNVDMRYWSICTNESYVTTRASACLYDEEIVTDRRGWYTLVLSLPEDRPAKAKRSNGINWLSLSPDGDGLCTVDATKPCYPDTLLLIRNMLPESTFGHAVQNTKTPGDEAAVMGDYLPTGEYMSTAAFQKSA